MLDFLTKEIKAMGKTVSSFIDETEGLNRASFYRMANERMNDNDFEKIRTLLDLSEEKAQELQRLIKLSSLSYSKDESERVIRLLYDAPEFTQSEAKEVEVFCDDNSRIISSYEAIAKKIAQEAKHDEALNIKIRVVNCLSLVALASLYNFFTALRETICNKDNIFVAIDHISAIQYANTVQKLEILFNVAHLVQFPNYAFSFTSITPGNSVLAEYENTQAFLENHLLVKLERKSGNSYLMFRITNVKTRRDQGMETTNENLYRYFKRIYWEVKDSIPDSSATRFITMDGAVINQKIATFQPPFGKVLIKSDCCLDNILPEIWNEYIIGTEEKPGILTTHPKEAKLLRETIDTQGAFSLAQGVFWEKQCEMLATRFTANERGSINIFDRDGMQKFVQRRIPSELRQMPKFTIDQMIKQLLYMQEQIQFYDDPQKQKFYFFRELGSTHNLFIDAFDTEGICVLNEACTDLVNSNFFFTEKECAKLFYDIISGSLPNERILSQQEAHVFLEEQLELLRQEKVREATVDTADIEDK